MEIPLRNRKGEIVAKTTVSEEDYEHLSQFKWYRDKENYVKTTINGKSWRLHRYIMIVILSNELTPQNPVDHKNNNPLDNTRENLRVVTHSENSRNVKKIIKENTTSEYMGVSKTKYRYLASIKINNKHLCAYYDDEIHAAHQYNLWVDELDLKTATKNNIEEPKDFVLWKRTKIKKGDNLPVGVEKYKNTGKFRVRIRIDNKEKNVGFYDKLDEAIAARKKAEIERTEYFKNKLLSTPKTFNDNGQCVFTVKDEQIVIDEEMFYEIIQYKWTKRKNYYRGYVNGKMIGLSNFIMGYIGKDIIDHINNNTLDNRKENLRIVTAKQNAMNTSSRKGSSSKYIGVCKSGKKWESKIRVNGENIWLGTFECEIEAAKARDVATKEHYKEYGNLNFPNEQR